MAVRYRKRLQLDDCPISVSDDRVRGSTFGWEDVKGGSRKATSRFVVGLVAAVWLGGVSVVALSQGVSPRPDAAERQYVGFDRNIYPGDGALSALREHFDFVGYWVTNPPGERQNSWLGKRKLLAQDGFGFAVLADGRTDAEIVRASRRGRRSAKDVAAADADVAVAAARREGFGDGTVLFLDQEEGGRLMPEQAEYLFGWTERVYRSGLRAGVYLSGQAVSDGPGRSITTAQDVLDRIAKGCVEGECNGRVGLHPVVLWVYQDACPPSNGCSSRPPPLTESGTAEAVIWQYAQSPRRVGLTAACAQTYAVDGSCYVGGYGRGGRALPGGLNVDLDLSSSADPSRGDASRGDASTRDRAARDRGGH